MMARWWIVVAIVACLGLAAGSLYPKTSDALPFPGAYVIKLYSGGEVVGTWRTEMLGMEELTQLTSGGARIPLGGIHQNQLFVSGTFSVEPESPD